MIPHFRFVANISNDYNYIKSEKNLLLCEDAIIFYIFTP